MGPERNILVNSPISTFHQGLTHSAMDLNLLQVCAKLVGNDFQFDVTVQRGRHDLDLILTYLHLKNTFSVHLDHFSKVSL